MKKKFGKILSILLTAVMLVGMLPAMAFANGRTEISSVVAKSESGDITPVYGKPLTNPTFTVTEGKPAHLLTYDYDWWKMVDGKLTDAGEEETFGEGTYCYRAQLRIDDKKFDGNDGTTHVLAQNGLTLNVDGKAWEIGDTVRVYDDYSMVWVFSPAFTVKNPEAEDEIPKFIQALAVKGIKIPIDGETADVSGITINNDISATLSEAQWFKEGSRTPIEEMTASDKFVAGKTYYLSIQYAIKLGYTLSDNPEILHDLTDGIAKHNASTKTIVITYTVKDFGITIKDGVASWNQVEGATRYSWGLDNNTIGGWADPGETIDLNERLAYHGRESGTYSFEVQAYNGNEAISDEASIEYVYTSTHTHDWAEEWTTNDNYHWHNCKNDGCGIIDTELKSGFGMHTFEGDICTACGKNASLVNAPVITITDGIASWTQIEGTWCYSWGLDNNTTGGWAEPGETINLKKMLADRDKESGSYSFTVQAYANNSTPLSEKATVYYEYTKPDPLVAAPTITIENGVASWNEVDGATRYMWSLKTMGGWADPGETIDLNAKLYGKDSGTYTLKVQAYNGNEAISEEASIEYFYTATHTHDWAEEWTTSEKYHWHECKNDGCSITDNFSKQGYGQHTYEGDTCTACGRTISLVGAPVITITDGVASWTQIEGATRYSWGLDNNTIGGWADPGETINLKEMLADRDKESGSYSFTVQAFVNNSTPLSEKATVYYDYSIAGSEKIVITSVSATITEPVAGKSPSLETEVAGEGYVAEVEWEDVAEEAILYPEEGDVFEAGKEYALWVGFVLEDGYEFADDATIKINGKTPKETFDYGDIIGGFITYTVEDPAEGLVAPKITLSNVTSTGKIKISWDAVSGAKEYKLYCKTGSDGTYRLLTTTTKTTVTHTGAKAGSTYYYKVKAVDAGGNESAYSNVSYRTCDLARPEITLSNVASTGKIKVSWEAISGAKEYEVHRRTGTTGEYTKITTVTVTSYTDTSAEAGEVYYYKVKAIHDKEAASSAYSAVKYRTCDLARPEVSISLTSAGKPRLTWKAIEGTSKYYIYRKEGSSGEYTFLTSTTGTSLTNTSAVEGKTYYYKVKAVHTNTGADSAESVEKSILCKVEAPEIKAPVIKLSSVASSGKIKITWDAVSGAKEYKLYSKIGSGGTYKLLTTTAKTTITHTGAKAGSTYYYKAVAIDTYGNKSDYSNVSYRTCDLARPDLSLTLSSTGKPKLTWDAIDGASKYEVYRRIGTSGEYKLLTTTTKTTITHTGATAGNTYYYKVCAIHTNEAANSAMSTVKSIKAQ